ncbi:MAG: DUF4340 domain-containing protein [Ruminococcus sp.]|nr:DUF4340 domain-containing protein [Ruminococcus sp.]
MKKAAKGILALTGVLAVLGGGLAALKLTEPEEQPDEPGDTPDSTAGTEVILVKDNTITEPDPETGIMEEGVVSKVDVTKESGVLHVVQRSGKTDTTAALYTLDGYQDVNLDNPVVGTLANNANGLTSTDIIAENCQELGKYGLEAPAIKVDVTYESGSETTFFIGDTAPSGDTYVMLDDGSNTVYTVQSSYLANYKKELYDFVKNTVLEEPEDDVYPIIEKLRIERDDLDYDIVLEYDKKSDDDSYTGGTSATHIMTEPTEAYVSVERSTDITNGMFGLTANDVYCIHCKDADIAGAGLNEPFCRVTMSCDDGKEYVLLLSEPFSDSSYGKCCYAMLEGRNTIYIISTDTAKWATVMPVDIASRIFIGSYVWDVTELSMTADGRTDEFVIERIDPDEEKSSLSSSDFSVTRNGISFDSERYRVFYSYLIKAAAEDFAFEEEYPGGEPLAEISISDKYTGETTKIEFFEYSNLTALIAVDGESKFFISRSYVDTLIANAKRLDTDEELVMNWK